MPSNPPSARMTEQAQKPRRRKPQDVPADEMLIYDMAHQRWRQQSAEQILDEAATLFNLAVFMVKTRKATR